MRIPARPVRRPPAAAPIDDITRRDLLRGTGALGAGWVLAGCGSKAAAHSLTQAQRAVLKPKGVAVHG